MGVDIGCGMDAVRTQFTGAGLRVSGSLTSLRTAIERAVPLSAGVYNTTLPQTARARVAELERLAERADLDPDQVADNWRVQLGSLGSGNHFIEVSVDEQDRAWAYLSLHSAPHGAGREHSRSSARRSFTEQALAQSMQGIEWSGSAAFLDEIPAAYKPIDVVMADAADLVQIRHTLSQILSVKGDLTRPDRSTGRSERGCGSASMSRAARAPGSV